MSSAPGEEILPGDIVNVKGAYGQKEGLVIGSHVDFAGRQVVEVQLDGEIYNAWYPSVTRVKRTVSYNPTQHKRISRTIYW